MTLAYIVFGLGFVLLLALANSWHLERGGEGPNAHKTTSVAWVFIGLALVIGMGTGSLPGMHENIVRPILQSMGVPFPDSSVVAPAKVPATKNVLKASKEGIALMDKHFPLLKQQGRKVVGFGDVGNDWYWCVVDEKVDPNAGQHVAGGEYKVADASVTEVPVYLARKTAGGGYEFGDRRVFPLK